MPDYLAQNQTEGTYTPENLLAGEAPIQSQGGLIVVSGQNLPRFQIVAYDAAGKLTAWDDTAVADADATSDTVNIPTTVAKPAGILLHACDASGGDKAGQAIYSAGCFNHELLTWPAGLTTLIARRAALRNFGAPFTVGALG